jgi:hypothetical protein
MIDVQSNCNGGITYLHTIEKTRFILLKFEKCHSLIGSTPAYCSGGCSFKSGCLPTKNITIWLPSNVWQ